MSRTFFVVAILTLFPALAFAGPFAGSFSGDGVKLSLRENGAAVVGDAVIEGNRHPVKGQVQGNRVQGQYLYDGAWVAFEGTIDGATLVLVSEGDTYRLQREGGAPPATAAAPPAAQGASPTVGGLAHDGWGIRMTAPAGWTGQPQGGGFVFAASAHKGMVVVFPHEASTTLELREGAAAGLEEGGGKLAIDGDPAAFGKSGIAAKFKGTLDGKAASGYAVGLLNPNGSGAVILAVAETADFGEAHKMAVDAIAKSVSFYKAPVPEAVANNSWEKDLTGSQLSYSAFYRSSGFGSGASGSTSTNIRITLCGDRSFWYRGNNHSSINASASGAYSFNKEGAGGTWSVVMNGTTPVLTLRFADGQVSTYALAYEKKKLYLGGDRYYWSKANCGG